MTRFSFRMLSRRFGVIVCLSVLISIPIFSLSVQANTPEFALQSRSAILMEASTGEVIFEKNADLELPPASISKIMTMVLIMEALEEGKITLDEKIRTSENAMRMGGSQIFLEVGEEMTLTDMLKSIAIASANDACVAVGEHLYGTEEAFVQKMNERARELGMNHTFFQNSTGLPAENNVKGNYSTARDIAIMSRELLRHPVVLQWTSTWMDTVRNGAFGLTNTNKLVRHYQGCDGLKTGYTVEAKYCLSATGMRNGLRFIAVVMGAPTSPVRNKEISEMLSFGFNTFKAYEVVKKDQVVQRIKVSKGKIQEVDLLAAYDFTVPMKKGTNAEVTAEVVLKGKATAPISAGQVLGELVVKKSGEEIGRVPLKAQADVEKGSIFQIIFQMLKNLFAGLVNLFR